MARLDVPTLQCDRCKNITTDPLEMCGFHKLNNDDVSGYKSLDLCKNCWFQFTKNFMSTPITWDEMYSGVREVLIAEIERATKNNKQTTTDNLASAASRRALDMMAMERNTEE